MAPSGYDCLNGAVVFAEAGEPRRNPGARHIVENGQAIACQPRVLPLPVGRGPAQRQQVRQEIGGLVHQVDPGVVVLDPDMHVHPGNQQPPRHPGEVVLQHVVAFLVGMVLGLPVGRGMAGHGQRGEPVAPGDLGHRRAQAPEILARLGDRGTDPGADLHLAAQELGTDLILQRGDAVFHHRDRRIGEIAGLHIDEEILLLDPHGEARLCRHVPVPAVFARKAERCRAGKRAGGATLRILPHRLAGPGARANS
jgi:hypothetical protein